MVAPETIQPYLHQFDVYSPYDRSKILSEMNTTYIYVGVITPLIGSLLIESITPLPTDVVNAFFKAQMP